MHEDLSGGTWKVQQCKCVEFGNFDLMVYVIFLWVCFCVCPNEVRSICVILESRL